LKLCSVPTGLLANVAGRATSRSPSIVRCPGRAGRGRSRPPS
jgi:hypothetical protein